MKKNKASKIREADYTATQVADYFILLASQKIIDENVSEGITPLKLQKLLYFGQAASLAVSGKKLFKENIEAWKYGPVIPSVYQKYKLKLNQPITNPTGSYKHITDKDTRKLIQGVWELFEKYSAGQLVEISHRHAPWKEAYEEGKNIVIPCESLRDYYQNIFELKKPENGK